MTMTLIEQLAAVITAIAKDISNNSGNSGNGSNSDTSDIRVLLPQKFGTSQKWYQSGLRYGADYPHPYVITTLSATSGWQYFVPFTALEDATITELEVQCTSAKSGTSVSLGIYASDVNNDLSNPLFTSDPMDCSNTGAKNATCHVQITKGNVYWLSSMVIGSPGFYRNYSDSLKSIKGSLTGSQASIIGYYTNGNSSIAQSPPTNKVNLTSPAPRVMFITS